MENIYDTHTKITVIYASVAVNMGSLQAQWMPTNGPYGGAITCFAVDSTTIFAGTYSGGVFLSTNNGQSWTPTKAGLINTNTRVLAADGVHLYAGTDGSYGGGLFVSTNNGASWTASGLAPQGVNVLALGGKNSDGKTHCRKSFRFGKNSYLSQVSSEMTENGVGVPHLIEWRGGLGDFTVLNRQNAEKAAYYDVANRKLEVHPASAAKAADHDGSNSRSRDWKTCSSRRCSAERQELHRNQDLEE